MFTRKSFLALLIAVSLSFSPVGASLAIEGGKSAKNHPRIVSLYFQSANPTSKYDGCSAFLYAPRIVVTQAHCLFDPSSNKRLPASKVFVGLPGKIMNSRGDMFPVKKIFMPSDYVNSRTPKHNHLDIAVMVTRKPVAMVSTSVPITEEKLSEMVGSGNLVTVGGYGLSSPKERNIRSQNGFTAPFKFPRQASLRLVERNHVERFMTSPFATREYLPQWISLDLIEKYAWVNTSPEVGATCDGDSGSGFFIQEGKTTIFIGANGGPMGSPNCMRNGKWHSEGGLNRIIPIYKHLDLLSSAIKYKRNAKVK